MIGFGSGICGSVTSYATPNNNKKLYKSYLSVWQYCTIYWAVAFMVIYQLS